MEFIKGTNKNGKHYLYIHVRLDNDKVFYIGVGTKYTYDRDYSRAKAKNKQRNNIWRKIVKKTDYKVIIINESEDYDKIKKLEIKLISKYGQIIKNSGSLCNLTDGGDGKLGLRNIKQCKSCFLYTKDGNFYKEFESYVDASKYLKVNKSVIALSINKNILIKRYIIKSYKRKSVKPILDIKEKLKDRLSKKVYQYTKDGVFIKEWESSEKVKRELKISGSHIRECVLGGRKSAGNFIWKNK